MKELPNRNKTNKITLHIITIHATCAQTWLSGPAALLHAHGGKAKKKTKQKIQTRTHEYKNNKTKNQLTFNGAI